MSNSLDMDFIHGDIHDRSCKKLLYDNVRCCRPVTFVVYISFFNENRQIIQFSIKNLENIYNSDKYVTFELYGHFLRLQVLYSK